MLLMLEVLRSKTRWNRIQGTEDDYRLSCSDPLCSLSCANLRNGRISVTSTHGDERHSYLMSKSDMTFALINFLDSLSEKDLHTVTNLFNKISKDKVINFEIIS